MALVPVAGPSGRSEAPIRALPHPDAGFVTQLLATRAQMPDYRAKRRAAPEVGAAAYRWSGNLGRMSVVSGRSGVDA